MGGAKLTSAPAVLVAYATIVPGTPTNFGPVVSSGSTIANGDSDVATPHTVAFGEQGSHGELFALQPSDLQSEVVIVIQPPPSSCSRRSVSSLPITSTGL